MAGLVVVSRDQLFHSVWIETFAHKTTLQCCFYYTQNTDQCICSNLCICLLGVNVVLNSLAEEKLQASIRCLARHGRFLEIGKYDLSNNSPLGQQAALDSHSHAYRTVEVSSSPLISDIAFQIHPIKTHFWNTFHSKTPSQLNFTGINLSIQEAQVMCKSISPALVQMKVGTGAMERQKQDNPHKGNIFTCDDHRKLLCHYPS